MNLRGGWALIKSTWTSWLQYRGFFFVLAFGWMIPPLASLFVWMAAAAGGSINGMTQAEFCAYYLILILVNQLTYAQANWTLGDIIRSGILNFWLLKPLPAVHQVIAGEFSGKVVYMLFVAPVAALLALVLRPELHTDLPHVLLFLAALVMAWALRFLWGYALALLAFWSSRADGLLALQDSLVFLLAGVAAPLALLPESLQAAARILPFRYMVGFPVEVLLQRGSTAELWPAFLIQFAWTALALAFSIILWRTGLRRYSAVGG
jgi:ABC-2 type transport system permease protein